MVFKNKELTFVATDGFRLAEIVFEKNEAESSFEDVSVIVPLKTTTELLRILDEKESPSLEVFIDQNQILFQTESQYIISRLIDGSFPEYHAIIPKQTKTELIVNRLELVGVLNLAKTFSGKIPAAAHPNPEYTLAGSENQISCGLRPFRSTPP